MERRSHFVVHLALPDGHGPPTTKIHGALVDVLRDGDGSRSIFIAGDNLCIGTLEAARRSSVRYEVIPVRPCLLILVACSTLCCRNDESETPFVDASPGEFDANRWDFDASDEACRPRVGLIGHCVDTRTGEPCRDFDSESRTLIPLGSSVVVRQIVGLQGAQMFVLGIWVDSSEATEGERPPLVQLEVNLGPAFIGGFTSRPDFFDDPDRPMLRVSPQLYIVTLLGEEAIGQQAQVTARITASSGKEFCSSASFEVGALIDEPM